jgi:hypothetical protein
VKSERITSDNNEIALANQLGDQIAATAWPGIFSGGKQIVATQASSLTDGRETYQFRFSDGSSMTIIGDFEIRFKEPGEQLELTDAR